MFFQRLLFIILLLLFSASSSKSIDYYSPENILNFADNLYNERDYQRAVIEYERYISLGTLHSEEILYKIGLCYRNLGNTDNAIKYFNRIEKEYPDTSLKSALYYQIAYSHIISGNYDESIKYIDDNINKIKEPSEIKKFQILKATCYLKQKRWYDTEKLLGSMKISTDDSILQTLRRIAQEGTVIKRKNPIFAGILSSIIPGLGRVYCNQYGDGIFSFMLTTITGALAYDAFRENNFRSIKGWLFTALSAIFYAGNIYGSYVSAKIYNNQVEMEILKNLSELPDDW
ncbi:MAG: tetratricopeptide repeat protein [bacterium]